MSAENLVCAETSLTCFGDDDDDLDLGCDMVNRFGWDQKTLDKDGVFNNKKSNYLVGFPLPDVESVREMVERERELLPEDDYLRRLRCGDLDLSVRREALDWILKACAHFQFGPLCICLSMNYLDRFLSVYELPEDKAWTVQLLAVSCLSLAAKMEETEVPQSIDLQVEDPKFMFEAKTIQRMELLILNTLNWRLQVVTPCSFIDYFLSKINDGDGQCPSETTISRSLQLILSATKGIDFLDFRPSEIAAAVAISVSGEMKAIDIEKAISRFVHVKEERVMKCVGMMKDLSSKTNGSGPSPSPVVPESPNGVLEATCLSYKSDERTVGSCTNSSQCSPNNNNNNNKRRKQIDSSQSQQDSKES